MRLLVGVLVAAVLGCGDNRENPVSPAETPADSTEAAGTDTTAQVSLTPADARAALERRGIAYTADAFLNAAVAGNVEVVQLFVEAGMPVDTNDRGRTALYIAASWGHLEVVEYLVGQGADVDRFALHVAALEGKLEVVQYLIEQGADAWAKYDGATPLDMAKAGSHTDVVAYLESLAADVIRTPGDARAELRSRGINYKADVFREAAQSGNLEVVRLFVLGGMSVNTATSNGWTALHASANGGHLAVVEYLVEHGADVNATTDAGWTALHYAAQYSFSLSVVEYLVEHGADVNATDDDGRTPLHDAARRGDWGMVEYLVRQAADVNATDDDGWTALHYAARAGELSIVRLLVEHEADVNATTDFGWTALDFATSPGHTEVVEYLESVGG